MVTVTQANTYVKIDGFNCYTFDKWKFIKAHNDGNLPATIECWLNSSGYLVDPQQEVWSPNNFVDDDTDEDCGWGTNFTPSANLYAKIADKASEHFMHIYDYDLDEQIDTTLNFVSPLKYDNPSPTNEFYFEIIAQLTGTYAGVCYSYYILIDHAGDEWLYFRVDHYTGQIDYSFDGTNYTDTTFDLSDESMATIYVQLTAADKFKLKKDSGSWSAEITNTEGAYDTSLDSFQILTTVANKVTTPETGVERFTTYNEHDNLFSASTNIGDFSADPGAMADLVADTAGGSMMCKHTQTGGANTQRSYAMTLDTPLTTGFAGKQFAYTVRRENSALTTLYLATDGSGTTCTQFMAVNIAAAAIQGWDGEHSAWESTGVAPSDDTNIEIIIDIVDTTHYDIWVNGTKYGNGGAHWEVSARGTMSNINAFVVYDWASGKSSWYDNFKPSWTYVAAYDTIYPVEAWVGEITDTFFVGVDLDNVVGKSVTIWNEDVKCLWKGYVDAYEMGVQTGDSTDIKLLCNDEFWASARNDVENKHIKYEGALNGGPTNNKVTITPALTLDEGDVLGLWATIRHDEGIAHYNQDSGGAGIENAECSAFSSVDGAGDITVLSGTYEKLDAADGDYHSLQVENGLGEINYVDYTISLATVANTEAISGKIKIRGHQDWWWDLGTGTTNVYVWNKAANGGSGAYENKKNLPQVGVFQYGIKLDCDIDITADNITVNGANWEIYVRIYFNAITVAFTRKVYLDYMRADIDAKKLNGYVPIEGRVEVMDSTTELTLNAIPFASQYGLDGDQFTLVDSRSAVLKDLLGKLEDVDKTMIDQDFGGMSIDYRGVDYFTAFKRAAAAAGIEWYLDVQEDGDPSVLHCRSNEEYIDFGLYTDATYVSSFGWVSLDDEDYEPYVTRLLSESGAYVGFKHSRVGGSQKFDHTVYRLFASETIDDAPSRDVNEVEFYFDLSSGVADMDDGNYNQLNVYFPSDSTYASAPYFYFKWSSAAGVDTYELKAYGNSGNSDAVSITADEDLGFGIKVVFDRDAGQFLVYYRAVSAGKMLSSWTLLTNCANCVLTEDPPVAMYFEDNGVWTVNASTAKIQMHQILIRFAPDADSTGTMTPGGDIIFQKRYDRIRSLHAIGGKDADGVELHAVRDVDTEGRAVVELVTHIRSQTELDRYADSFVDNYEADKCSIKMSDYIDNETAFHTGYFYTFDLGDGSRDELLRRAEASWDSKSAAIKWVLEFGKGHTFGKERLFNAANKHDANISELRLMQ